MSELPFVEAPIFGLIVGAVIFGLIGARIAPAHGFTPIAGFSLCLFLGLIGLAIIVLHRPGGAPDHPSCVPCGAFATYTIAGQPLCEDHARSAVKVGWQAEPIR